MEKNNSTKKEDKKEPETPLKKNTTTSTEVKNYLKTITVTRALLLGLVIGLIVGGAITYNIRPKTGVAPQEEIQPRESVIPKTSPPTISLEEQKDRIINYMLQNMVSSGTSVEIDKITEDKDGLYKLEISQEFEGRRWRFVSYATKDGEILFPAALNMSSLSASATPIFPSTTTPPETTESQIEISQTLTSSSSSPDIKWTKTYGGTNRDCATAIKQTSDGGYIMAGCTESYGAGNKDVYFIKTDSMGDEIWSKTFGGKESDLATSVQQTSDGGYIIAGMTSSFGKEKSDAYLIKTDSQGNEQWSTRFGGIGIESANTVQLTSDGGYIIAGYTGSIGQGKQDVYLIKTHSTGEEIWSKTFGGTYNDQATSVQQTSDGGYIIAGYTESFGVGDKDVYLIKTDADGNEVWSKTFGGTEIDQATSVQQTSDGGYIIAGDTESFGVGDKDMYLIKTDVDGDKVWSKTFGGPRLDLATSVQQTSDGGYITTGHTESYGQGSLDVFIVKTDPEGNERWSKGLGGSGVDSANAIQQTSDGGYILAGYTESLGAGQWDVYLIKLDA